MSIAFKKAWSTLLTINISKAVTEISSCEIQVQMQEQVLPCNRVCSSAVFHMIAAGPRSAVGGHLTCKSEVLGSMPGLAIYTFVAPSADSRGAVVSYWQKYVHQILVNLLGGLSLPRCLPWT